MHPFLAYGLPLLFVGGLGLAAGWLPVPGPLTTDELAEQAIVAMKVGDPRSAGYFQDALAQTPDHVRANFGAAMLAYDQQRFDDAEKYLKAVVAKDATHFEAWITLGALYQKLKRLDEAEAIFQKLRKIEPKDSRLYFNLAYLEVARQRYPKALEYTAEYLRLVPAREGTPARTRMVELEHGIKELYKDAKAIAEMDRKAQLEKQKLKTK